jgi:hypothetical protein
VKIQLYPYINKKKKKERKKISHGGDPQLEIICNDEFILYFLFELTLPLPLCSVKALIELLGLVHELLKGGESSLGEFLH